MQHYTPILEWIDYKLPAMIDLVTSWSNINTHCYNTSGLGQALLEIHKAFLPLHAQINEIDLPTHSTYDDNGVIINHALGKALHIKKERPGTTSVFLGGHMDTVFPRTSLFQKAFKRDKYLYGPGVCDMKGGLVIMLYSLLAFERSPFANSLSWEVVINPDEEIGSPGSNFIHKECAKRNTLGLLFEPSFTDGAFVRSRGGSMNLVIIIHGKSAHAGRDFFAGKSAIYKAARLIQDIEAINTQNTVSSQEIATVNVGEIHSGNGFNIVPDLAVLRINVRADTRNIMEKTILTLQTLIEKHKSEQGYSIELHEVSRKLPKPATAKSDHLLHWIKSCQELIHQPFDARFTRGVCDGNFLTEHGLACIDSLGAKGGGIHTTDEYIEVTSLAERCKLVTLLLMKIANKEFTYNE